MNQIQLLQPTTIEKVAFQSGDDAKDKERYYFAVDAFKVGDLNDQNYRFLTEAVPSTIESAQAGRMLAVNHTDWGLSGLGFGHTVDANYVDPLLQVTSYIALGFTTPNGPFANTNELVKAVEDGFVRYVSVGGAVKQAECSICGKDYRSDMYGESECSHIRGFRYEVSDVEGETKWVTCEVNIKEFELKELSLAWLGSDRTAAVQKKDIQMAAAGGLPFDTEKRDALRALSRKDPKPNNGGIEMADEVLKEKLEAANIKVDSLNSQIGAKDTEINTLKASVDRLEKETSDLKAQAQENERLIADGKVAREKAVELNLEAFTKVHPDMKEAELKAECEKQEAALETFSLEQIYANTDGYVMQASKLYPEGRVTGEGTEEGGDPQKKPRPRKRAW